MLSFMQIRVGRGRSRPALVKTLMNLGMTKLSSTKKAIPRKEITMMG